MVSGREQAVQREASLRRVAIVLSQLPEPVAARLLGSIDPDGKRRLREAMRDLTDVDPWEQRLALQSFAGSLRQAGPAASPTLTAAGDEIRLSGSAPAATPATAASTSPAMRPREANEQTVAAQNGSNEERSPLAFLETVSDRTLVELLSGEHPQTVALVLASIAPAQAARVLPQLQASLRQEAISRIGRLGEIPDESVQEIARHLQSRVAEETSAGGTSSGQRALTAILAELNQPIAAAGQATEAPHAEHSAAAQGEDDSALQQILRLHQLRDLNATESPNGPRVGSEAAPSQNVAPTERHTSDETSRGSAGERLSSAASPSVGDDPAAERTAAVSDAVFADREAFPPEPNFDPHSPEAIHEELMSLSPQELCRALGRVETRQAMLALCGLPAEVADAVLGLLPRSHEKRARRQLASLGSLRIRDIDEAKAVVAEAARELHGVTPRDVSAAVAPQPLAA